jgi:multimeric flavodoxin WrbA
MNIIAIIGSPHGMKGNTGRLLFEVVAGAAAAGAKIEILPLASVPMQPCVACNACHVNGICPLPDGFEAIKTKLLAADGFILASPNYIFSVTAQMKILFDRLNGLIHCQALQGKYGAVVETSGGGEDEEVLIYMQRFVNSLGAQTVGGIGSPMAGIRTFPDEGVLFVRARTLGADLVHAIRDKRYFPEQAAALATFGARMEGLVSMMQAHWPYERDVWQRKKAVGGEITSPFDVAEKKFQ